MTSVIKVLGRGALSGVHVGILRLSSFLYQGLSFGHYVTQTYTQRDARTQHSRDTNVDVGC